ncbi:ribosomal protein L34Ae protein [Tanacetum coccineum]
MKDLGRLKYFLGIEVLRSKQGIFMYQKKYVLDLLAEICIVDCKPADTPMIVNQKLYMKKKARLADKGRYQRMMASSKGLTKRDKLKSCGYETLLTEIETMMNMNTLWFSEEEQEQEEEEEDNEVISNRYYYDESTTKDDLLAHINREGQEDLFVLQTSSRSSRQNSVVFDEEIVHDYLESPKEKEEEVGDISVVSSEDMDFYSLSESEYEEDSNQQINNRHQGKEEDDEISMGLGSKSFRYEVNTPAITTRARSACTSFRYVGDEPSLRVTKKIAFVLDDDKMEEKYRETGKKIEANLTQVDKSSSEWQSSITCRDTGYDPFSSSSRRSCPKWESYTVFQKYNEEMLFLDRISVQKLKETGSFRSSTTHQSSISEKIIHKLSSRNKKTSYVYKNSYHELEEAYVAQICLTWEALNWNYNYFQQLRASRRESDPAAYIAQQFQQFQVVLQRYIENEPYQNGRRPIVFARMRSIAPKLLQVPEYRDSDDEKKDKYLGSRISLESFLGNQGQIHGVKLLIAGNSYSSNLELPMSSKFAQHKLLPVHDTSFDGTFRWDLLLIVEILEISTTFPSLARDVLAIAHQAFTRLRQPYHKELFKHKEICYRSDTINNSRGGRVGGALQDMGTGQDLLVKIGAPVPLVFPGPILVCSRNDDLDVVLNSTPQFSGAMTYETSSFLKPSRQTILTLNVRDEIPKNGFFSSPAPYLAVRQWTQLGLDLFVQYHPDRFVVILLVAATDKQIYHVNGFRRSRFQISSKEKFVI